MAEGKGNFSGDILILLWGTDNKFDLATDATIGFSPSENGSFVHTGFNKCFQSILPEIKKCLSEHKQPIDTVHCIGHSLGGALATLTAEWLKNSKYAKTSDIKLYTFGSPRVGASSFVKSLTREMLKGTDICRVYHKTDVVPMVPIWPFFTCQEKVMLTV
ncbi:lipase family protein [Microbulbifer hainanensis]|uniref:lipase family protein n=1 Tax=Microbulbifer hainanensis TaxID=2735675 RepID=UPI0018685EE9